MYICERCVKEITPDDEYEEIVTHFFHTKCYIEGLVGAIASAPDKEWLEWREEKIEKYKKKKIKTTG